MSCCGSSFILIKILAGVVVVCLAFLLVKGFSFALPNINPSSYALQISLKNLTCADGKDYRVVKDCTPCSSYDMKFEQACKTTGNVKTIECLSSKEKYVLSCPFSITHETKKFWVFEGCLLLMSVFFCFVVWWRRRSLDNFMYQRLKKQISASA